MSEITTAEETAQVGHGFADAWNAFVREMGDNLEQAHDEGFAAGWVAHVRLTLRNALSDAALVEEAARRGMTVMDAAEAARLRGVEAEAERLTEHSIFANHISWRIAEAVGDVPEGAESIEGDPDEQLTRLIAEGTQTHRHPSICGTHRDEGEVTRMSDKIQTADRLPGDVVLHDGRLWHYLPDADPAFPWQPVSGEWDAYPADHVPASARLIERDGEVPSEEPTVPQAGEGVRPRSRDRGDPMTTDPTISKVSA